MFNLSENSSLRGSGHMVLNFLRAFNIIGLLTVCAASWVMIVMTGMTNSFFFFDAASHFFTSTIAILLIISEMNLFSRYFENNWPVLSPRHGLSWLGIAMIVMGCHVLGNLNKPSITPDNIGLPLWRLVLSAGVLSIIFGFFNVITSVVFRDGKNGITSRNIRSDGSLASAKNSFNDGYSVRSNSVKQEKNLRRWTQKISPWGNGKPKISHPIIHHDVEEANTEYGEDRRSPIMPEVPRPPTALHPMNTVDTRYTKYSTASHLDRF